jgi:hypothetical protein
MDSAAVLAVSAGMPNDTNAASISVALAPAPRGGNLGFRSVGQTQPFNAVPDVGHAPEIVVAAMRQ